MNKTGIFYLAFVLVLGIVQQTNADNPENIADNMLFQEVNIKLAGTAETKADYFAGKNTRSVIFAPGAMFSKESWHFLAARFQDLGIGSVDLNSVSTPDLLNGIAFLKAKGVEKIAIIRASAGGAGVLYTLRDAPDPMVDTVDLLAPAGGAPLRNNTLRKLFIVAEDDMISSSAEVYKLYKSSSKPKLYKELKGSDHVSVYLTANRKKISFNS